MKIKKSKLTRIIKEEMKRVISEQSSGEASIIGHMRKQFQRASAEMLNDMENIYDDMLAIGLDDTIDRFDWNLLERVLENNPSFAKHFISFHLRKFVATPVDQLLSAPSGEQIREEELEKRAATKKARDEAPPRPWVQPDYGWGTRIDPETGEEIHWTGRKERFN